MSLCAVLKRTIKTLHLTKASARIKPISVWWGSAGEPDYRRRKAACKKLLISQCPANGSRYKYTNAMSKRAVFMVKCQHGENRYALLSNSPNEKFSLRCLGLEELFLLPQSSLYSLLKKQIISKMESHQGYNSAFSHSQLFFPKSCIVDDFVSVTVHELSLVVRSLPSSDHVPDVITTYVLKMLFEVSPQDLFHIVNHSLRNGQIHPHRRMAKITCFLKQQGVGARIINIRPITIISHVLKLVYSLLYFRINKFIANHSVLSICQIGFRLQYTIQEAHIDLE